MVHSDEIRVELNKFHFYSLFRIPKENELFTFVSSDFK